MSNWYAEDFDDRGNKPPDVNPFTAGDAWQKNATSDSFVLDDSDYRREGDELVVTTGSQLPAVCIKSGSTSQLNPVTVTLSHFPPWAFLVGGVLLAILFQKKCKVTYFVNKEVASLYKKRRIKGILGIIPGVGLVIGAAVSEQPVLLILAIIIIIGAIILLVRGSLGLAITRHEKGVRFWIKGFDRKFFERLENARTAA